eukprot:scaffold188403_cov17-Tisochrysis_lutea.AAC.1
MGPIKGVAGRGCAEYGQELFWAIDGRYLSLKNLCAGCGRFIVLRRITFKNTLPYPGHIADLKVSYHASNEKSSQGKMAHSRAHER